MAAKDNLESHVKRIAAALERLVPKPAPESDLNAADAYVWHAESQYLEPIKKVSRVDLDLLQGIDRVRDILLDNTRRFAKGLAAYNVLLWGARGMGKSSLVKASHAAILAASGDGPRLKLIEIH